MNIDPVLHDEILCRYNSLGIPPYKGFINPVLMPVTDCDGQQALISVT